MREGEVCRIADIVQQGLADGIDTWAIGGWIGAGKTTFLAELAAELARRSLRVYQRVEERPEFTFREFLKNPALFAFRFQMGMLNCRAVAVAEMRSALDSKQYDVALWDRSVHEDEMFYLANVHFGSIAVDTRAEYDAQRAWAIKELGTHIGFLFVQVTRARALEQIKMRGRPGEIAAYTTGSGPAYLDYLCELYPPFLERLRREGYCVVAVANDTHRPELVQSAETLDLRKSTSPVGS